MRASTDPFQLRVERTVPSRGFAAAERIIDRSGLTEERRAALWLYAWSLQRPAAQRRHALALYEELA